MGKITLKTVERKTSVTREEVRAAVAEVFKNDKNFNLKSDDKSQPAKRNGKKAA